MSSLFLNNQLSRIKDISKSRQFPNHLSTIMAAFRQQNFRPSKFDQPNLSHSPNSTPQTTSVPIWELAELYSILITKSIFGELFLETATIDPFNALFE